MVERSRPQDLGERTKAFAVGVIRVQVLLPKTPVAQVLGRQLLRCGTSVGAHVREARRSRSDAELLSKVQVALQELEETAYWLELLVASDVLGESRVADLRLECLELTRILMTSAKTLRRRRRPPAPPAPQ